MAKKFNESFSTVMKFEPYGLYLSRNVFKTKEEAAEAFSEYYNELGESDEVVNVSIDEVKEAYVRFEPTPWELRDELGDMAWMVCNKEERGAQPCWVCGD